MHSKENFTKTMHVDLDEVVGAESSELFTLPITNCNRHFPTIFKIIFTILFT